MKTFFPLFFSLLLVILLVACSADQSSSGSFSSVQPSASSSAGSGSASASQSASQAQPEPEPQVDRRAESVYLEHPELTPVDYDSPALLPISEDMGQAYLDNITFLCDSPTYWLWPFGMLKDGDASTQIWTGPEGTMTLAYQSDYEILDPYDGQLRPIREVVELHKPPFMIIALGINGISFMDEAYFVSEYTDLVTDIQAISPETILVLQSIYPITPAYRYWGSITNASITLGNSWILQIAEDTGCKYLDTFSVLVGEDGNARAELMMEDGLHPNREGLELVLEYIRTHGYLPEEK